jgi:hypothetical protein
MSAIAALTLTDAAGTPVNHTYSPIDCTTQKATWAELASGVKIGRPVLTLAMTDLPSGVTKVELVLIRPNLEAISGDAGGYTAAPQVAFEMKGVATLFLPGRSTLQDRKDLLALFRDALSDEVVEDAVWNYDRPF